MLRSTSGIVFCSMLFTVGTLLLLLDSNSPRRLTLRHSPSMRRSLYNWSKSSSSSSGSSYNRNSSSRYSSSSSNNSSGSSGSSSSGSSSSSSNNGASSTDDDSNSGSSSSGSSGNYGNNYANYNDNASNNAANYDNQNYDNTNYIWQNDDIDYSTTDDGSYYNSNKNYQANGSNYNGRGQWGGQSVQRNDDVQAEVTVYGKDADEDHWSVFSSLGSLSAKETAALSVLLALFSLCLLFLLGCGCNIVDICQLYICCGIFRHKNVDTSVDPVVDGFVKLGDY